MLLRWFSYAKYSIFYNLILWQVWQQWGWFVAGKRERKDQGREPGRQRVFWWWHWHSWVGNRLQWEVHGHWQGNAAETLGSGTWTKTGWTPPPCADEPAITPAPYLKWASVSCLPQIPFLNNSRHWFSTFTLQQWYLNNFVYSLAAIINSRKQGSSGNLDLRREKNNFSAQRILYPCDTFKHCHNLSMREVDQCTFTSHRLSGNVMQNSIYHSAV